MKYILFFIAMLFHCTLLPAQTTQNVYNEIINEYIEEFSKEKDFNLCNDTVYFYFVDDQGNPINYYEESVLIPNIGKIKIIYSLPDLISRKTNCHLVHSLSLPILEKKHLKVTLIRHSYALDKSEEPAFVVYKNISYYLEFDNKTNKFTIKKGYL